MNLRDLQYLVAVYDLNSFSKAAERCFVSQPTLSGQLKKMEDTLGCALMERSTRQILFTPVGEQVVAKAREILQEVDNIKQIAKGNGDDMEGDFHLGFIPTVGPFLLPLLVPQITATYPKMKVFLHELQTHVLLDKLHKGELDAIVLAKLDWPLQHALIEWALYTEPMLLAVSEQHQLANKHRATLDMLKGQPVLMLEDGHCLRDQALGVCFASGAEEDSRFQATSMDTLLHMVANGMGITLIPKLASATNMPGIRYLPFDEPQPSRDIVMLARNKNPRVNAFNQIAELIKQAVH